MSKLVPADSDAPVATSGLLLISIGKKNMTGVWANGVRMFSDPCISRSTITVRWEESLYPGDSLNIQLNTL